MHVVAHDLAAIQPRVVRIAPQTPVHDWCAQQGIREAVSGGFSVKPEYEPLGELWTEGRPREDQAFQGRGPIGEERSPSTVACGSTTGTRCPSRRGVTASPSVTAIVLD